MLVVPVPCINQRNGYLLRQLLQHTCRLQTHNSGVDPHRFQRTDCIVDRLAFFYTGSRRREVQHLDTQTFLGHFKGKAGARAVLKKHIGYKMRLQHRIQLLALIVPVSGSVQKLQNLCPVQLLNPQQTAFLHLDCCHHCYRSSRFEIM
ncbi:hypothetical protein D3C75_1059790 [compost metagenome]